MPIALPWRMGASANQSNFNLSPFLGETRNEHLYPNDLTRSRRTALFETVAKNQVAVQLSQDLTIFCIQIFIPHRPMMNSGRGILHGCRSPVWQRLRTTPVKIDGDLPQLDCILRNRKEMGTFSISPLDFPAALAQAGDVGSSGNVCRISIAALTSVGVQKEMHIREHACAQKECGAPCRFPCEISGPVQRANCKYAVVVQIERLPVRT